MVSFFENFVVRVIIISPISRAHIAFIRIAGINAPLTCPASFSVVLDPFRIPLSNGR
jgi:hypothetical protein